MQSKSIQNAFLADGTQPFYSLGGYFQFSYAGTWGGGTLTFNQYGPDAVTQLPLFPGVTANGITNVYLPPGEYQAVLSGSTSPALSYAVTQIPLRTQ